MSKPICEHYENPCCSPRIESNYIEKSSCCEHRCCERASCCEHRCCERTSCCEPCRRRKAACYESSCCEPCCGGPFFTFPNFFTVIPPVALNGG